MWDSRRDLYGRKVCGQRSEKLALEHLNAKWVERFMSATSVISRIQKRKLLPSATKKGSSNLRSRSTLAFSCAGSLTARLKRAACSMPTKRTFRGSERRPYLSDEERLKCEIQWRGKYERWNHHDVYARWGRQSAFLDAIPDFSEWPEVLSYPRCSQNDSRHFQPEWT